MAAIERHDQILRILAHRRRTTVRELGERLAVSEVTVRKDLAVLEELGRVQRTRGGAVPAMEERLLRPLATRNLENVEAKAAVARSARRLVRDGDTIFLDSGSTTRALASLLKELNLRVVTNSVDIVLELSEAAGVALYCLGGSFRRDAGSFIGPLSLDNLGRFQFDLAFLGTSGFSEGGAFSSQNVLESEVKRAALAAAKRRVVLMDSSKDGKAAFSIFARPGDVDIIITDRRIKQPERIEALGFELIIAEDH